MARRKRGVYRDGKVHVMKAMCSSCIFRDNGIAMQLQPGRVEQMVRDATAAESCIPCHTTTYGQHPDGEAVCAGFFKRHATAPLQIAQRLDRIEWVEEEHDGAKH